MRSVLWFAGIALVFFGLGVASAETRASTIFCREGGQLWDALTEDGHFECAGALMVGDACFVGRRRDIIAKINNLEISWDEEWLEGAHYKGRDSISYVWVDGPNELREPQSMNRCTPEFLRR
ncbi:MAG TPA: hypothetical protein PLZ57_01440 [Pseudobdellovibrionaceae bacterium]|nr:hypothetical protein [Pseudobdellovibrionaceae bacterium]